MGRVELRILGATSLLIVGVVSAHSDGAEPAGLTPPAQSYNWTGLYVGAHAGGAQGDSDWSFPAAGSRTSPGVDTGAILGAQVGIRKQFASLVIGAEVSYSGTLDVGGSATCPNPSAICSNDLDGLLLANGQIGFAWGGALLYATGGYARANVGATATFPASPASNEIGEERLSGWNFGGGVEYYVARNVSLGVEYIHVSLDDDNFQLRRVNTGAFVETAIIDPDLDLVRARLNIKLDRDDAAAPLK